LTPNHQQMRYFLTFSLTIFLASHFSYAQSSKVTVSGFVREKGSRESLIGVNVYLPDKHQGTTTNNFGFYSLTLPAKDSIILIFSFVGYSHQVKKLFLKEDIELNVELSQDLTLDEVVVQGEATRKVSQDVQMSKIEIPISQIKAIPAFLGEKDVLKVLQLMPGVQKGSEGNSGIYVRGGGPDQNLIILDDAIVYNAYHLFGFFSLFNGDALKSVELTKGGFPARYGARLSSVIEMNLKDGNKEEFHGSGGIGIVASRLTLEGPIKKGKSSFIVSGRRTYIDALARPLMDKNEKGGYYFYDLNAKLNYDFGRKNKLYLSGYFGRDKFSYKSEYEYENGTEKWTEKNNGGFNWGNATGTLRWNHLFRDNLFANTSLIFSNYSFAVIAKQKDKESEYNLRYTSGIRDLTFKYDWDFLPNPQHSIKFGLISTHHRFTPSAVVLKDTENFQFKKKIKEIDVVESALYVEDTYRPISKLRINGGLRLSHFYHHHAQYLNPEPRIATSYNLTEDLSLKASYALMNQYVHLISNTGVGLPTDLWVPATKRIKPQQSQQVAVGIAKDFTKQNFAVTVEGYYKKMNNIIGYKEGASFLLIDAPENSGEVDWEDNLTSGQGWSYGVEVLIQRKFGKFSGWIGYTLSWTQLQFDSLNFGRKYWARYDRRHDISVVGIYNLSDRITLSGTWVYGSGNAITLPTSEFSVSDQNLSNSSYHYWGETRQDYGEKNGFRMAPYHRMDFGVQFHKKKKWGERTWEINIYNLYNRKNPFFYTIGSKYNEKDQTTTTTLRQISLFPIIPSISYSFKF
jgi:hypothetical protein